MEMAASNVESFFPRIHGKAVALMASTVASVCPFPPSTPPRAVPTSPLGTW